MNQQKNILFSIRAVAGLFVFALSFISCTRAPKEEQSGTHATENAAQQFASAFQKSPAGLPSPVYVIGTDVQKQVMDMMDSAGPGQPRWYDRKDMVAMTSRYARRMLHAEQTQHSPGHPPLRDEVIDSSTEYVYLYLDGNILKTLLQTSTFPHTTGLLAILAVHAGQDSATAMHQTFLLVPFNDSTAQVTVVVNNDNDDGGIERWPSGGSSATTVRSLSPQNGRTVDDMVRAVFTAVGMH